MTDRTKELVLAAEKEIRAAYLGSRARAHQSVVTMHAHRAVMATLDALGLDDVAVNALLDKQAAVVATVDGAPNCVRITRYSSELGRHMQFIGAPADRLDKPMEK